MELPVNAALCSSPTAAVHADHERCSHTGSNAHPSAAPFTAPFTAPPTDADAFEAAVGASLGGDPSCAYLMEGRVGV